VPSSVLFDALLSKLQSTDADPVSILEMLSCLLGGDSSLLTRAIDARIAVGDDAAWLKLLSSVRSPNWNVHQLPMEVFKTIRDCVTSIIQDVDADPEVLLDALTIVYRSVEKKTWTRALLDTPGLEVDLIRLLRHPASVGIQLTALKVLTRSFELRSELMPECLRDHLINLENFGHFCSESMIGESQSTLYTIVYYINRESTIHPFYMGFLPLVVLIMRVRRNDYDTTWTQYYCLQIIRRCVSEVGRPAAEWLLQHDPIRLLIDSILVPPFRHGVSSNWCVCCILAALLISDVDDHGDDGVTLHPWMARLVGSKKGLLGLEGTHAQATAGRCVRWSTR
jgi:hypothetical protein